VPLSVGVPPDSPELTDSDVSACLTQVRQGDEAASRALIRYMHPLVYKLVRSNISVRGDEEDLVQTIVVKAFKGLHQFSGQVPFKHWVSRIAVNTCLNSLRYEKRRPEIRLADLSENEAAIVEKLAATDGSLDQGMGLGARDLVQTLVSCLHPKERILVRLVYLEGLTLVEASQSTGWSLGSITMRMSRARAKMRKRHDALTHPKLL
jgi:RNA polymerase sigma-70 factor (ECF subfamily)